MIKLEYFQQLRAFVGHNPIILPGVLAILTNEKGQILLQHRTDNTWGLPGGLMELGESLKDTARRINKGDTQLKQEIIINLPIEPHEVPTLRELVGWDGRHSDYPTLFERCNFWAGQRNAKNELIAFGYVAGMGLQHGYMEDIIVHPQFQMKGLGQALVKKLLQEAEHVGLEIVTLTYDSKHTSFYTESGFTPCSGGLWRRKD